MGIDADKSWFYPSPCLHNVLNALNGRVGKHVPKLDSRAVAQELTPLAKVLGKHMQSRPCTLEEVYKNYTGLKRARYERAHRNLEKQGGIVRKRQSNVDMFVKMEAYKLDPAKPFPDCRAIQYRSFEYTLKLASKIRPAEHRMYGLTDVPGYGEGPIFAKNMNQFRKAEVLKEMVDSMPGARIVCCDFSRFDAHLQTELLRDVEHVAWNTAVGDPELATLLSWQLRNKGRHGKGEQAVRYSVRGERMSGDANTAGGNCIISATVLSSFFNRRGHRYRVLVDGDDSVVVYYGPEVSEEELGPFFERYGMVIAIESKPGSLEEIEFCQSHPVCVGGRWTMVRNPIKVLTKMGMTHHNDTTKGFLKRLLTTATCEGFLSKGVPILQTFCRRYIQEVESRMSGRQKRRKFMSVEALSYRMQHLVVKVEEYEDAPVSMETRKSFAKAFGIGVQQQIEVEGVLRKWSFDPSTRSPGGGVDDLWFIQGPYPEYV